MIEEFVVDMVNRGRIKWQRHAFERMLERDISRSDIKQILLKGELIEEYADDHPFPSGLFLGFIGDNPLHVVAAIDREADWCYIITAYKPDLEHFEPDFKTRRNDN